MPFIFWAIFSSSDVLEEVNEEIEKQPLSKVFAVVHISELRQIWCNTSVFKGGWFLDHQLLDFVRLLMRMCLEVTNYFHVVSMTLCKSSWGLGILQ